jgi:hypothetical protein
MPAVSEKQKRFMDAAAHNPSFAKKAGVPTKVAKEFSEKSKGMKFGSGGTKTRADRQVVNQPKTDHGDMALFKKGGQIMATKSSGNGITKAKMGAVRTAAPSKDGIAAKGKTKGTQVKMTGSKPLGMKKGGMTKKMAYGGKAC